jgi:transposase-like protein
MMGAAYSVDLRRKVVQAYESGTVSQVDVARFYGVSLSFVEKLLRLHRRTGARSPSLWNQQGWVGMARNTSSSCPFTPSLLTPVWMPSAYQYT